MGNSTGKSTGWWSWLQPQSRQFDQLEHELQNQCATPIFLTLDFLKAITRDFSQQRELRRDGFGVVYKGVLKNGKALAVKKLESHNEFPAEVALLGKVRHPNLHGLRAYHLGRDESFLVFDYMPKGSLLAALFYGYSAKSTNTPMDWATRIATAKGIARGLAYLHDDMSIIHGNLTARNVLFDEQSQPKIADFGLFRFMTAATNYNVLDMVRELGYCAPELINLMNASAKTDVYSLGIIILQLLTGTLRGGMDMLQWVGFKKSVGLTTKVFDMELMQDEDAGRSRKDELEATLMLALQCVDPSPLVRPQAREVLAKLEKICPGQENATGPSKDPSPSMQLQARNDLEQVRLQQPADLFKESHSMVMDHSNCGLPWGISFSLLEKITNGFSEECRLGSGAFGEVYKGTFRNGNVIAVKKLFQTHLDNDDQFQKEVTHLLNLKHQNIVQLIGYCAGGRYAVAEVQQRLLCFEYLNNGSLHKHLSDSARPRPMEWATRMAIAKGIVRALTYLHDEMDIIHGNLTSRNVLLDEQSHPKISDYGLFRLMTTATNSNVLAAARELGYCAPELSNLLNASTKTDVYSLGIIILELLTGKSPSGIDLPRLRKLWRSDTVFDLELMWDREPGPSDDELVGTLKLALQCVEPSPSVRPLAREVLEALEQILLGRPEDKHLRLNGDVDDQSFSHRRQQPTDFFEQKSMSSGLPRNIPFHQLEEITAGFSKERKLGNGAFGEVYMGVHKDGEKIAVKMLYDMPGTDEEKFINEFRNLASLQHRNIVRLVGYCHETQKTYVEYDGRFIFAERIRRALCLEYMHHGSLEKHLSDEYHGLDWNTRYTLIKGICNGLKYLHEESQPPIYHLDLKPANILLDENMLPKIADFGLSRLFGEERTQITKASLGTLGYLPPEYIERNIISSKFDIFSLGVIMIKIMTGPSGYSRSAEMSPEEFIELVHENWTKRIQAMHFLEAYSKQVKICMEIALSSVEVERHKRPSIGDIIKKLNETEIIAEDELVGTLKLPLQCGDPCPSPSAQLEEQSAPRLDESGAEPSEHQPVLQQHEAQAAVLEQLEEGSTELVYGTGPREDPPPSLLPEDPAVSQ